MVSARLSEDVHRVGRGPFAVARPRERDWSGAAAGLVLAACVAVPCIFTTRVDAVFVVPKLGALWAFLALVLALVSGGVLLSRSTRGTFALGPVDIAIGLFVVLTLAAWAVSADREQSLYGERLQYQGALTTCLYVAYFYVARVSVRDARRLWQLSDAVLAGAALVAAYALVQRAGLDPVWNGFLPGGRVFSSIGQPNALAAYLVLATPLSAAALFVRQALVRALALVALATMLAALVFTFSRGGYLGLLAALVVLALGWRRELSARMRRPAYIAAAAVVAGATIVAAGQARGAPEQLERVLSASDESARIHVDLWRVAAQVAAENPVLGTGPETFPLVFPRYSHAVLPTDRAAALDAYRVESPHNVYLGIAAGSGLPALIAYLGVLAGFAVATVRAARRAPPETRVLLVAALAAIAGHAVTDAFVTADLTSTWLAWTMMGAVLGFIATLRR